MANSLDSFKVLCPLSGVWTDASCSHEEPQRVWAYTMVPYNNATMSKKWIFHLPRPHHLPLLATDTYDLRIKDTLVPNRYDCGYDASAWGKGFMYRLGLTYVSNLVPNKYPLFSQRLKTLIETNQIKGIPAIPNSADTVETKGSWVKGYLSADGFDGNFATASRELFDFFIENHGYAGLVLTGSPRAVRRKIRVDRSYEFYTQNQITYTKGTDFKGYRCQSISGPTINKQDTFSIRLKDLSIYAVEGGWTVYSD